ncbi:MAG TPA: PD-(D/E)XK nuclease family protein [Myxococcales bacterium]|nr:PD-(D/E)XK nuclease family protein [Myxococcales bacterium]
MRSLLTSAAVRARLDAARQWLCAQGPQARVLVVGASPDAAADLVREAALACGAAFGWQRFTLARLAAVVAAEALAERGLSPLSPLGMEAVCARVIQELKGSLGRFEPIGQEPGLPRALSRTVQELRLAGARPAGDLGRVLDAYEAELRRARLADRAEVFRLALEAQSPLLALPALLVDVPLKAPVEERLLARLSGPVFAVAPAADAAPMARALGVPPGAAEERADTSLARVQQRLFIEGAAPAAELGDDVVLLSAPGESRECVEIARRILREAQGGVPFDRMAVLLRSPAQYRPLLEEAFARAGIPAHFASATLRPDPAGRAFLALLACAGEGLSARRFAEYLSLGEVPEAVLGAPPPPPPPGDRWVPPDEELTARAGAESPAPADPARPDDVEAPVVAGSLRAPRHWEQFLMEAAVIGGRDRWERRLQGLDARFRVELQAFAEDEAKAQRIRRQLDELGALREFALPLLDTLAALPKSATWAAWLDPLTALASRALREPGRVLSLLAELAPMGPVGPVSLAEVRLVLGRRLTELSVPASGRRYGKVYVAPVHAARGLAFQVVLVPGLAEKLFPQKVIEDPLLRDDARADLSGLETSAGRIAAERLGLRLAAGAASARLILSWPRIDLSQGRARVPSFYGLEVMRAAEGTLPGFGALSRRAEQASQARAGWPAPPEARDAIDEAEHDLALLARALRDPARSRGTAAYLLTANPWLGRAVRARARRSLRRWTSADGVVEPGKAALEALQAHQPAARSWSPTALQNYAACPYKLVLQAIHRLAPREVPEAIDEIDPLSRGSLIHEAQYELLSGLSAAGELPVRDLAKAQRRLEEVVDRVAGRWQDELAPAIERVWNDCIAGVKIDLREWLRRLAEDPSWTPWRFELSFGLPEMSQRDPHSSKEPVTLDEGLRLRGSIDLVEQAADGSLRATDHKTGRAWVEPGTVIGGGGTLQPALYALALEKLFPGSKVEGGRLYYCTHGGDYTSVPVALDAQARGSVQELAKTLGEAVAQGFLPAAPRDARECERCDYLEVCGPSEWQRTQRKPKDKLVPLERLRKMP